MTAPADIVVLLFGACIGSFLNVCIYRIPLGLSIVSPSSRCPDCEKPIRFYDNLPLVSFLMLGGRCRSCKTRISFRYPIVEGLTALLAWALFLKFGLSLKLAAAFLFVAVLVIITFIDLDHQIIPDILSLPGIPLFFLLALFVMDVPWREALLGLLIGGGSLYAVAFLYEWIAKREGMGGGDIKLLAMVGAFLGWKSLLAVLLIGSMTGAIVGIVLMVLRGRDLKYAVPFGPFLSLGAVAYLFLHGVGGAPTGIFFLF